MNWYYDSPTSRRRVRPQMRPSLKVFGVLMGLGGQLHLMLPPFGTIPMLDILSYLLSIPLLICIIPRLGSTARMCVCMGFSWALAAVIANVVNGYESMFVLKMFAVCSSSWTIFLIAWYLLEKDSRVYLYYLVGVGVGGAIAIHYFQNGAYLAYIIKTGRQATEALVDKQIFPAYAKAIFFTCLGFMLTIRKSSPLLVTIIAILSGFYLLFNGGSRSNFGFFIVSAFGGFVIAKFPNVSKRILRRSALLLPLAVIGCLVVFSSYTYLARTGKLGESELKKYLAEEEYEEEMSQNRMSSRAGIWDTWEVVKEKPWGEGGNLARHSVISNAWNCEGYMGLCFWLYFYWLVFWYIKNKIAHTGWCASFILLEIISACWAVAGSPFGTRHHFFVFMAFVALSRDDKNYGEGTLYNEWRLK